MLNRLVRLWLARHNGVSASVIDTVIIAFHGLGDGRTGGDGDYGAIFEV